VPGVAGAAIQYSCEPIPEACSGAVSCDCLADEPCGDDCQLQDDGGFLLSCFLP
jgi:hypothetical protein